MTTVCVCVRVCVCVCGWVCVRACVQDLNVYPVRLFYSRVHRMKHGLAITARQLQPTGGCGDQVNPLAVHLFTNSEKRLTVSLEFGFGCPVLVGLNNFVVLYVCEATDTASRGTP